MNSRNSFLKKKGTARSYARERENYFYAFPPLVESEALGEGQVAFSSPEKKDRWRARIVVQVVLLLLIGFLSYGRFEGGPLRELPRGVSYYMEGGASFAHVGSFFLEVNVPTPRELVASFSLAVPTVCAYMADVVHSFAIGWGR